MANPPVYILGAGGHAKVVIATLHSAGYVVAGLYDDDPGKQGQAIAGILVKGTLADVPALSCPAAVIAIGDNYIRQRIARKLLGINWATAIHSDAIVAEDVVVGAGTVVFAGSVLQPGAVIGSHAIINTGATVDHDCQIGDCVHVAPGCHLAGNVVLEQGVMMGIGSIAVPGVRVGAWAKIGAGSVVTKNIPPGAIAVGVPARIIKLAQQE